MQQMFCVRLIKPVLRCFHLMFRGTQEIVGQEIRLVWIGGKLFTSELVMFCSTSTRIHLCADNGHRKENYNQSPGRKEGTAHTLQPNIFIYKELIKYHQGKVASRFAIWWLDWGMCAYVLPNSIVPLLLFHPLMSLRAHPAAFISAHCCLLRLFCLPHFTFSTLLLFLLSDYFFFLVTFSAIFLTLAFLPSFSSGVCQFSSCELIFVATLQLFIHTLTHTLLAFLMLTD